MRLKKTVLIFFFFIFLFVGKSSLVQACPCGTSITQINIKNFTSSAWFDCPAGTAISVVCDSTQGSNTQTGTYGVDAYWNPGGIATSSCSNSCPSTPGADGTSGTVYETVNVYCGDCTIQNQQSSTNTNTDTTTTTTTTTTDATPTPGTFLLTGSTNLDVDAAISGSYCAQSTSSPLSIAGIDLYGGDALNVFVPTFTGSDYSMNTLYQGGNFTVVLDLSGQTGGKNYVCSCPAPADPNNPYYCRYPGVVSPGDNINFYVKEYNLSNLSWLQVFGGNAFGKTTVSSSVPYNFCVLDANCQAAMIAPPPGSTNKLASGFAITNTGDVSKIKSSVSSTVYHSYFHLANRTGNVNSYGVFTDIAALSYDYFYNLVESSVHQIGDGSDLEPLLSDWTNAAWWSANDINYVRVNGNVSIDESQGFNLTNTQNLVVFVDGNLTLDDSNPNDANRKTTSVANGGFLAFFVSGNILITPNVGYELNPLVPTVPTVSNANSNIEGVYVADGNLIVQTKLATGEVPPDKKFIGSGTFIGWTNVITPRTFNDNNLGAVLNNNQAIDNFIYRPDLLANWPTKLKASVSNWREVDPQLINQ